MNSLNENRLLDIGFKKVGNVYVGKVQDGFFTVYDNSDPPSEIVIQFGIGKSENKGSLFMFLDEYVKKEEISKYENENDQVNIYYSEKEMNDISYFIKVVAEKMHELKIKCECCNCENTENLAFYSNGYVPLLLCKDCGEDVLRKVQEDKDAKNNYLIGFLYSIIGAIIGSVLWIILGVVGIYASIAGYAISYCAFKGYKKAKGKLTVAGIVLNIIAIVIAFIFAEYMGLYISFYKDADIASKSIKVFNLILDLMFKSGDVEFIKGIALDFIIGLIFAALGTSNTIKENMKAAKAQKEFKVEKILPLDEEF